MRRLGHSHVNSVGSTYSRIATAHCEDPIPGNDCRAKRAGGDSRGGAAGGRHAGAAGAGRRRTGADRYVGGHPVSGYPRLLSGATGGAGDSGAIDPARLMPWTAGCRVALVSASAGCLACRAHATAVGAGTPVDRTSTRLNSSHIQISYAVFCLKKKKKTQSKIQ